MNYFYSDRITDFCKKNLHEVLGTISKNSRGTIDAQNDSWIFQIEFLKTALEDKNGHILFEFSIPRLGKRVDCILLLDGIVFILEFKVGSDQY